MNKKQKLQEKKNSLSKSFSDNKDDKKNIQNKVKEIKVEIEELNKLADQEFDKLNDILLNLPNVLDDKTPVGKSEEDNVIIKEVNKKRKYNFQPKNHLELSEIHDLIDYPKAIKISGSRFSILKNELAILYRGLINFLLDHNTKEFDYKECVIPELVKASSLEGTGNYPNFMKTYLKLF